MIRALFDAPSASPGNSPRPLLNPRKWSLSIRDQQVSASNFTLLIDTGQDFREKIAV
jgi:hypothetical protein